MNQLELFPKPPIIPMRHEKDDKYTKHCVDCGVKVVEYEYVYDGIETSIGKCIYSIEYSANFAGRRCKQCNEKLKRWVEEYYDG